MRIVQFSVELSAFWTPLRSNERRFLKLLKHITSKEGPEGVKWELGLAGFCPGKLGFKPLGLGFGHWELE